MTAAESAPYLLFLAVVLALTVPAGRYLERVFSGRAGLLERLLGPLERGVYRLMGVDPKAEMGWQEQAWAFTLTGLAGAAKVWHEVMEVM